MAIATMKSLTEHSVTLELTYEEAKVLKEVCGRIGGSSDGPRGRMDAIGSALYSAGVLGDDLPVELGNRAIYFRD